MALNGTLPDMGPRNLLDDITIHILGQINMLLKGASPAALTYFLMDEQVELRDCGRHCSPMSTYQQGNGWREQDLGCNSDDLGLNMV